LFPEGLPQLHPGAQFSDFIFSIILSFDLFH
jgi:hypothetical protein